MTKLTEFVNGYMGLPLSMLLPLHRQLYPLDSRDFDKAFLFGTDTDQELFLTQSSIRRFLEHAPVRYALGGYTGNGVNSYAVFVVLRDKLRRIYFRLPLGGVCENFLPAYFEFQKRVKDKASDIIALDSMCLGMYKFKFKNGHIVALHESLYPDSEFQERFKTIWEDD